MKNVTVFLLILAVLVLVGLTAQAGEIKSAGIKGNWSVPATWVGGVVPTAADNVTIVDGDTVTLDTKNIVCTNLTIGGGASGVLQTSKTDTVAMVVSGDILVKTGGAFRVQTNSLTATIGMAHRLDLGGSLTNSGGTLDFRTGSAGSTLAVLNLTLSGTRASTLNCPYVSSSNGEFNKITINKTLPGKVVLASDIITAGGSSTGLTTANSGINFNSGIVETGDFKLVYQGTTAAQVTGGSSASYIVGNFGRGMSSSVGSSKDFIVGDADGYKPLNVRSTTSGSATGHLTIVKCLRGNANSGSSTFTSGIDKVSAVRYYSVSYGNVTGTSVAPNMSYDRFRVTYGTDDGVTANNMDLRVAYSTNNRATWNGVPITTPDTTRLPGQTGDNALATAISINNGESFFVALARATGTTTNSLVYTPPTSVGRVSNVPTAFALEQNYPNPFNPSTTIKFQIASTGFVTLKVFDMLGREVSTLVSQQLDAGSYQLKWDASGYASGMYLYTLQADNSVETRKLMLVK
ncbi:MAG: T9SS type A sorting domain-containing protein [Ignavibacteriales bacterium]|nr:T9SS type A sorting domain-containing protein [Ignavibacteriales bacterium]